MLVGGATHAAAALNGTALELLTGGGADEDGGGADEDGGGVGLGVGAGVGLGVGVGAFY